MQLQHTGVHRAWQHLTSTAENDGEGMCQVAGTGSLCSGCRLDTMHSFFMFNMTAVLTADSKL